jgi:hypothetical protein
MGLTIPVLKAITRRCQLAPDPKINSEEWKWLIQCSAVDNCPANYVFYSASANGWGEALHQPEVVWVLPCSLIAVCAQIKEYTVLIKVMLIYKVNNLWLNYCLTLQLLSSSALNRSLRWGVNLRIDVKHFTNGCLRHSLAQHWVNSNRDDLVESLVQTSRYYYILCLCALATRIRSFSHNLLKGPALVAHCGLRLWRHGLLCRHWLLILNLLLLCLEMLIE